MAARLAAGIAKMGRTGKAGKRSGDRETPEKRPLTFAFDQRDGGLQRGVGIHFRCVEQMGVGRDFQGRHAARTVALVAAADVSQYLGFGRRDTLLLLFEEAAARAAATTSW